MRHQAEGAPGAARTLSIRWKLVLAFLVISLIPLAGITIWDALAGRRAFLNVAEQDLLLHAQRTVQAIEAYLRERRLDVQRQAHGPVLTPFVLTRGALAGPERRLILAALANHQRTYGYLRVALLRTDGEAIAVGAPLPLTGAESQRAFRDALAGRIVVSDPFFAGPDGPYILEIAAPVGEPEGRPLAAILFALPFDVITAIIRADTDRAGSETIGVLLDEHMVRIAHGSDPALIGRPLARLPAPLLEALTREGRFGRRTAELVAVPTGHDAGAEHLAALRRGLVASPFYDLIPIAPGQRSRAAAQFLTSKPWMYTIATPYDRFLAPVRAAVKRDLMALVGGVTAACLLAWGFAGLLTRRLIHLAGSTERLATGDFAARAQAGPPDEIGRVARSFNAMAQALADHRTASQERIAALEALNEVGRAVTSILDPDEVLSVVVEKSAHVMHVDAAAILAVDAVGARFTATKSHGLSAAYFGGFSLASGEGVAGAALRTMAPAWTEDIHGDPRFPLEEGRRSLLAAEGVRAMLAAPIQTPSGPFGVLVLYRREARPFDEDQVRLARLLADQAGIAIENARLHEHRFEQMVALSEALKKLVIAQPLETFFRDLVEVARHAVKARYGALAILGSDGRIGQFIPVGLTDEEVARIGELPRGLGLLAHMLHAPGPLRLDDLASHPDRVGFPPHHPPMLRFLGARIAYRDQVIGALYLTEKVGGGPFTAADERLVEAFAANAAVAIANARAYQEVQDARQALHDKTRELETFTYTVSHDLKAPLRGIDGFSRALQEDYGDRLDVEGRRYLEMIRSAARRMDDLIEDLLKYSRLERHAVRPERVDLAALCDRILEDRRRQIEARQVRVRLQLAVAQIEAEPGGLREAIANLVDNAIKFSKPGGSITVATDVLDRPPGASSPAEAQAGAAVGPQSAGDAGYLVVSVRDEGIGFHMKYHDRIFEIFQRLHRAEDYEGTGVGLAIVKKVAERHGGRAWATSEPGTGSTFYIAIPNREGGGA